MVALPNPEVFRRAAELLDLKVWHFACHALRAALEDLEIPEDEHWRYKDQFAKMFRPSHKYLSSDVWWSHSNARPARIFALLLMAEICEQGNFNR